MKNQSFELEASVRSDIGKGASRRLRREHQLIPAIIYGGKKDVMTIHLPQKEVFRALENEAFYSHILDLKVDGKKEKVVLKDMQRHPFKPIIQHMDFLRVSAKDKITMQVPLHFLNEDIAPGVKVAGGVVAHYMSDVEIKCLPKDLPEFIEVDLAEAEMDTVIHLSELKIPEGVELTALSHGTDSDNDQPVVSIHKPKRVVEETEEAPTASEVPAENGGDDVSDTKE